MNWKPMSEFKYGKNEGNRFLFHETEDTVSHEGEQFAGIFMGRERRSWNFDGWEIDDGRYGRNPDYFMTVPKGPAEDPNWASIESFPFGKESLGKPFLFFSENDVDATDAWQGVWQGSLGRDRYFEQLLKERGIETFGEYCITDRSYLRQPTHFRELPDPPQNS